MESVRLAKRISTLLALQQRAGLYALINNDPAVLYQQIPDVREMFCTSFNLCAL